MQTVSCLLQRAKVMSRQILKKSSVSWSVLEMVSGEHTKFKKKWGNLLRNIGKGSLATDGDIQDTGVHVVNTVLPTAAEAEFMFGSR